LDIFKSRSEIPGNLKFGAEERCRKYYLDQFESNEEVLHRDTEDRNNRKEG
jgi:hypothetical protein